MGIASRQSDLEGFRLLATVAAVRVLNIGSRKRCCASRENTEVRLTRRIKPSMLLQAKATINKLVQIILFKKGSFAGVQVVALAAA